MSEDGRPKVVVTSDGGGWGMVIGAVILVAAIVAAIWFFNQNQAGDANVDVNVTIDNSDPGTETTITP
ncbi:MAG: hypothetical protein ACRDWH_09185 [Acidimicrobiia bacterium]